MKNSEQLFTEVEVNSGGYLPSREVYYLYGFFTSIKRPANYLSKRNGDRWYNVITDNNKKTRTAI